MYGRGIHSELILWGKAAVASYIVPTEMNIANVVSLMRPTPPRAVAVRG